MIISSEVEFQSFCLSNGIKVIHKQTATVISHIGLMVNSGSRDEYPHEHGMAHFIEHALFKGTKKRSSTQILHRLEEVGGEINAYTTKEETCLHASFLNRYYGRALELLADLFFNSVFPPKELEKEKEVIVDEIRSYEDSPSDLIHDVFEEMLFKGHSMGQNILGTEEHLMGFDVAGIKNYRLENHTTDQIVISSVGNITFEELLKLVKSIFGDVLLSSASRKRIPAVAIKNDYRIEERNTHQAHCIIGGGGFGYDHSQRLGLYLISNYLGGPFMSSRLNMILREKMGVSYNVESNYTSYSDTGVLTIYIGTDKKNLEICQHKIREEFASLREKPLSSSMLEKMKRQVLAQLAISSENGESLMLSMAKSFLVFDRVDTFQEIESQINKFKAKDLQQLANVLYADDQLTTLIYI